VAEVQVHGFVRERGELVAEADLVGSRHRRGVREAVVLLLLLIVQDIVLRIGDEAVHVVVASCDDLREKKTLSYTCGRQIIYTCQNS